MNLEQIKTNKTKMILQFAIPSIIAMVLTSMINIVDGFFIGNYVGKEGLAAVNLGLPIVYLYLAVGLMVSVGGISIAGRLLGKDAVEESNAVFRQTMMTVALVSVILTCVVFVLITPISRAIQADELTRTYFVEYNRILLFELPFMIIISSFGMFIRGEGNPVFVMKTNILNVILNIILDYGFIQIFDLGVAGIAAASLISALIIFGINVLYFLRKSKVFRFGAYRFSKKVLYETFTNGSSELIGEMSMFLSMSAYNYVILKYIGVDGVVAFTIVGYVSYVFSMIIIGFGQGIVPLVSFSWGAEGVNLAAQIRKITNKMVAGTAGAIFVIMFMAAGVYCRLFTREQGIIDMAQTGLRLQMTSFVFAGMNTITSFYFTAIGKAKESAVISSARGLVILLVCIFTLPALFGITGVWFVSLTTETITIFLSAYYIRQEKRSCSKTKSLCI